MNICYPVLLRSCLTKVLPRTPQACVAQKCLWSLSGIHKYSRTLISLCLYITIMYYTDSSTIIIYIDIIIIMSFLLYCYSYFFLISGFLLDR